ncbi:S26 family signal peptidase, partial [Agrococcus sp. HG114]|uniref:S26 family signal peptidase n=1 Tax=Agrococcus sp. HG114 TaxID=2969757 RepID=UPI00215A481D
MSALRRIAIALLAILAAAGGVAAVVWAASLAGLAQPVVVATASMQPTYRPGDLLLATPVPVAELEPGAAVVVRAGVGAPLAPARLEG